MHAGFNDTEHLTAREQSAIAHMQELGILYGNDDGTFAPNRLLNRAEFMTMVSRSQSAVKLASLSSASDCFADVLSTAWYAGAICHAKDMGIIVGEKSSTDGKVYFHPDRPVMYSEALKILHEAYAFYPTVPSDILRQSATGNWYDTYAAVDVFTGPLLTNTAYTKQLSRVQAAVALSTFLDTISTSQQSSSRVSISSARSSIVSRSSVSSVQSVVSNAAVSASSLAMYDTASAPSTVTSRIVPLGAVTVPMGGMRIFSPVQPVDVTEVRIDINAPALSLASFSVYRQDGRLLGNATRRSTTQFVLPLSADDFSVPNKQDTSLYVRGHLHSSANGGVSGEVIQISRITIEAIGKWDTETHVMSTTETYPVFQTARSLITDISNAGSATDVLIAGTDIRLGSFILKGSVYDGAATLAIQSLQVYVDASSSVTVSNIELYDLLSGLSVPCTILGRLVTCNSIPEVVGTFEDAPRIVQLFGTISILGTDEASLQVRIADAGTFTTPGSLTWTDGFSTFHWWNGASPVARSTLFTR